MKNTHKPTPVRRCGTEGRTGHQGRERGNDDGDRDNDGNRHGDKDGGGNGSGKEDENGQEGKGEREPGNLPSDNRDERGGDANE